MIAWFKRWGVLIVSVVLVIVGFLVGGAFTRKLRKPGAKIKRELDVMKAGSEAAAHSVESSAELAMEEIEKAEEETIESLDETRRAKYDKVRKSGDAERSMRFLARYADPSRRKRYRGRRKRAAK